MTGKRHRNPCVASVRRISRGPERGEGGGRDAHLDGAERRDGGEGEGGHRVCEWRRERCVRAMTRSHVAGATTCSSERFHTRGRSAWRKDRSAPSSRSWEFARRCCVRAAGCVIPISLLPGARVDQLRRRSPDRGRCPRCQISLRRYRASRRRARLLASRRVARRRRAPGHDWSLGFRSFRVDPDPSPDAPSCALARRPPDRVSPPSSLERIVASSSLAPPRPRP